MSIHPQDDLAPGLPQGKIHADRHEFVRIIDDLDIHLWMGRTKIGDDFSSRTCLASKSKIEQGQTSEKGRPNDSERKELKAVNLGR
jgi:hypothetical protein